MQLTVFDCASHQMSAFAMHYQPLVNHKAAENRLLEVQVSTWW